MLAVSRPYWNVSIYAALLFTTPENQADLHISRNGTLEGLLRHLDRLAPKPSESALFSATSQIE